MLKGREIENVVKNFYGVPLSMDMDNFTENVSQKMELFWRKVYEGQPIKKNMYSYLNVIIDEELEFESESESEWELESDNEHFNE